jgi:uncharacterized Rmd1/YagE family protein
MKNEIIAFCKKYTIEILAITIVVLAAAVIFLSSTTIKQQDVINQLSRDNSEQKHIISMAFQKSQGNVYTDYVQWENGTLYIPVLYRGAIIILTTSNYSTYQSYNMANLYRWIESEYYSGMYSCVGVGLAIAGSDMENPFSPEYADISCTGEGEWINLDAPLDRNNEGHSNTFNLGYGQVSISAPQSRATKDELYPEKRR